MNAVELECCVVSMDVFGAMVPGEDFELENVSGRLIAAGDDKLTYCVRLTQKRHRVRYDTGVWVRVCPVDTLPRRALGQPECGFATPIPGQQVPFHCGTSCQVVYCGGGDDEYVDRIYFSLVDRSFEPNHEDRIPRWFVESDDSQLLAEAECIAGRWHPLPAVHPDPAVDPGVPIERRPQGTPRWYWFRSLGFEHHATFGGQISGSRLWKFIGGDQYKKLAFIEDVNFKGNHYTRFGKANEAKVVLNYLLNREGTEMHECGSFPHPRLKGVSASPDGIITDPARTADRLPEWYRQSLDKKMLEETDWTRGVFEAKCMLQENKRKPVGPTLQPSHVAQMYLEMMCSGCHWAEAMRYCHETKEVRIFRLYLKPAVALDLERCIERMMREMIGGSPYPACIEHETNKRLIKEFRSCAAHYNNMDDPQGRRFFMAATWNEEEADRLGRHMAEVDMVALGLPVKADPTNARLERLQPTVEEINAQAAETFDRVMAQVVEGDDDDDGGGGGGKTSRKRTRKASSSKSTEARKKASPSRLTGNGKAWAAIEHTTEELTRAFANGDWALVLEEGVLREQAARYIQLAERIEAQVKLATATTATTTKTAGE